MGIAKSAVSVQFVVVSTTITMIFIVIAVLQAVKIVEMSARLVVKFFVRNA